MNSNASTTVDIALRVAGRRYACALLGLACLLLAGCGFHLQGAVELPEANRRVYIATADLLTPFAIELRRAVERAGGEIAPTAGEAGTVLRVSRDRTGRRVLSVSARNTPQEYEVFYGVEYSVDRAGQEVLETQVLELHAQHDIRRITGAREGSRGGRAAGRDRARPRDTGPAAPRFDLRRRQRRPPTMRELGRLELAELRVTFKFNDADGDGALNFDEFVRMMLDLESGMSFGEARNGFEEIDTDHSGAIGFDEFIAWWTSV